MRVDKQITWNCVGDTRKRTWDGLFNLF